MLYIIIVICYIVIYHHYYNISLLYYIYIYISHCYSHLYYYSLSSTISPILFCSHAPQPRHAAPRSECSGWPNAMRPQRSPRPASGDERPGPCDRGPFRVVISMALQQKWAMEKAGWKRDLRLISRDWSFFCQSRTKKLHIFDSLIGFMVVMVDKHTSRVLKVFFSGCSNPLLGDLMRSKWTYRMGRISGCWCNWWLVGG